MPAQITAVPCLLHCDGYLLTLCLELKTEEVLDKIARQNQPPRVIKTTVSEPEATVELPSSIHTTSEHEDGDPSVSQSIRRQDTEALLEGRTSNQSSYSHQTDQ